jgi:hypothetical protein
MNPHEMEKLLGGYATDTLTEEERRTLFEAALGNQALFDALADEQALRELLQDPPSRAHLLAALGEERVSALGRLAAWMRRPSVLALAAAVAAGIVTIAIVNPRKTAMERPPIVAMSKPPQQEPAPLQSVPEGAPKPKAAAVQKLAKELPEARTAKKDAPERDAVSPQNGPAGVSSMAEAPAAPQALPPPPPVVATAPPPPPPPAAQAPRQLAANQEVQTAQAKRADAIEARKEAAPVPRARDLYYATEAPGFSGFMDRKTAKAKTGRFGGAAGVVGGVPGPASARSGGVRYSILKRSADGSFTEVDPAAIFAVGDALKVRFETNQAGSLAVMERQPSGVWTLRMAARTQPGEPSESTINVTAPGAMHFFVRFSRMPRSEARLDGITPTADLLREDVGNAMYVVNPAWTPQAAVDFELTINAK